MSDYSVIIYDDTCAFCSICVNFIFVRDQKRHFRYTPLTSEYAQQFFMKHEITDTEALWLIAPDGRYWWKSGAALRIIAKAGLLYRFVLLFLVVPAFIRDFFYDIIKRNRHKLVKNQQCIVIPNEFRV